MEPKASVLIVDDTVDNIHFLGESLCDQFDIEFATNGPDALAMANSEYPPDLILLDIMMPGMDGYEVCLRLKASPKTMFIPVIFLTVKDDIQNETKGLTLGAVDYITKPFSIPIITARIKTHLDLKRKTDMLTELSSLDGLTGIANRRRFDDYLYNEWSRCQRHSHPISLLMIDIDYFKPYNDHYGHGAGDDCIKMVASQLSGCLRRPSDLIARYGGEEFAAVLPETDTEGAITIAEEIRAKINALQQPHEYSKAASYLTISIGVATLMPDNGDQHELLLRLADEALYRAKDNGRNQVQAYHPQ